MVQGEYVSFNLRDSDNDDHPYQAGEVRGVCDGWLMCETRNAARASRESEEGDGEDDSSSRRAPRRRQNTGRRNVKPRGSGPREGGNEEWVLTRRSTRGGKGSRSTTRDE